MRDARVLATRSGPGVRRTGLLAGQGMMLGLAIGDALGNTSEGMSATERKARFGEIRNYLRHPRFGDARGYPSDDTQLAFWTLERLIADGGVRAGTCNRRVHPERDLRHRRHGLSRRCIIAGAGGDWRECGVAVGRQRCADADRADSDPPSSPPGPDLWADTALCAMLTHNDSASISCVSLSFTPLGVACNGGFARARMVG